MDTTRSDFQAKPLAMISGTLTYMAVPNERHDRRPGANSIGRAGIADQRCTNARNTRLIFANRNKTVGLVGSAKSLTLILFTT